jgi:UDP-2,4-diacetamido-2,4,6-trideoxy-beta-L-altropyranose hydrolase
LNVYIRVDASNRIGSGHVMRCLTLAHELRTTGADVSFICRELPGNLCDLIEQQSFKVIRLIMGVSNNETYHGENKTDYSQWLGASVSIEIKQVLRNLSHLKRADWIVVDHYSLDEHWEHAIRPYSDRILVIDDLANRRHDCDLLLDQNLFIHPEGRYDRLVPPHTEVLLGPQYALLRREFKEERNRLRYRSGIIQRILIFFGGSDSTNETAKTLRAIESINRPDLYLDVVVGSSNPNRHEIELLCQTVPNAHFSCQINNMAERMFLADLALGAGGSTTWERCYLALPSLTVIVAENQREGSIAVHKYGASHILGWFEEITSDHIAKELLLFLEQPEKLRQMSQKGLELMGDLGEREEHPIVSLMREKVN